MMDAVRTLLVDVVARILVVYTVLVIIKLTGLYLNPVDRSIEEDLQRARRERALRALLTPIRANPPRAATATVCTCSARQRRHAATVAAMDAVD